jgi:hypothetical protein
LTTAKPCAGVPTPVTDRLSPSRSVSFARTEIVAAVSSAIVVVSLTATGPSFALVTVTLTIAVAAAPFPSLSV